MNHSIYIDPHYCEGVWSEPTGQPDLCLQAEQAQLVLNFICESDWRTKIHTIGNFQSLMQVNGVPYKSAMFTPQQWREFLDAAPTEVQALLTTTNWGEPCNEVMLHIPDEDALRIKPEIPLPVFYEMHASCRRD